MKIDFSALTDTHITACAHLYCKVYKEAPWFEKSELEPVIAFIREHLNNNYFRGYIARHDDNIVAVSIGFRKPWPGGVEYYIDEFFVDPGYQGKGVGSALMNFIADRSLHEGLNAMILNTHKAYPSDFFYRKNGFDGHQGLIILSRTLE
ncbi:GNAT family N-acetyltransferase [Cronobacter malonaticus]|uniref:GNAT family N-acetyltransferase n=1 Tax=Cronobacter malonaticus TaxID=413503 RepID=UPI0028940E09|nr:GNAT family N-acetyltransferase [Cronobacter malonaticus]ELY5939362.1 GNAT family N-acetyltransferase [Cronobacter malonaticus]ELY6204197.1 GNAT family N-acetyltransferase [Cronobacter malonaticus]ELY6258348.1 GNAT family N-acetyltransferase [Cronobacter malonaticus]MDT3559499.1 GNAT family N-acetyltransferase [Cronobacter malonaticus]